MEPSSQEAALPRVCLGTALMGGAGLAQLGEHTDDPPNLQQKSMPPWLAFLQATPGSREWRGDIVCTRGRRPPLQRSPLPDVNRSPESGDSRTHSKATASPGGGGVGERGCR